MTPRSVPRAPGVSVVIPCHNGEAYVSRAILSVLSQTEPVHEIIVVDDGSTDGTPDVVRAYGDSVRYIRQDNAGVAAARNAGIAATTSRWVAFLDADDEWLPHKLERQLAALAAHPQLRWSACAAEIIGAEPPRLVRRARRELEAIGYLGDYFDAVCWGVFMHTSGFVVESDFLRSVGGFDVALRLAQDQDLWSRLAFDSPAIGYTVEPCYRRYADVPGSLGKKGLRTNYMLISMENLLRLAAQKPTLTTHQFRRYAREVSFRLLVAGLAGREQVSAEAMRAHLSRFPPSRLERLVLEILWTSPPDLRRRVEGPIRDAHRAWCAATHRPGPRSAIALDALGSGHHRRECTAWVTPGPNLRKP